MQPRLAHRGCCQTIRISVINSCLSLSSLPDLLGQFYDTRFLHTLSVLHG